MRYLEYIRDSIEKVFEYTSGDFASFESSEKAQDATVWRLQTLADASWNHLHQQLKDRHPQLPWREIYGFRNVAAHGYAHLNLERIWEIAHEHLGPLLQVVQQEIAESDQRSQ